MTTMWRARVKLKRIETSICSIIDIKFSTPILDFWAAYGRSRQICYYARYVMFTSYTYMLGKYIYYVKYSVL